MKANYLKAFANICLFIIHLTISLPVNAKSGGAIDGGGGTGIMTDSGKIKLTDLADVNDIANSLNSNKFQSVYPERSEYLGENVKDFFSCSRRLLSEFENQYPALKLISNIQNELKPIAINFRLILVSPSSGEVETKVGIPAMANASLSVTESNQEPLAAYNKGRLWIAGPVYNKMDNFNRCGLQIHESLRHLNYKNGEQFALTTAEIEQLTRYFMGISKDEELDSVILKKLKYPSNRINENFCLDQVIRIADSFDSQASELNKIISNSDLPKESRENAVEVQTSLRQKAASIRVDGIGELTKDSYIKVDQLNIPAILLEKVITEEYGPWDIKTLKKIGNNELF